MYDCTYADGFETKEKKAEKVTAVAAGRLAITLRRPPAGGATVKHEHARPAQGLPGASNATKDQKTGEVGGGVTPSQKEQQ